jgi:hypothetical protein
LFDMEPVPIAELRVGGWALFCDRVSSHMRSNHFLNNTAQC